MSIDNAWDNEEIMNDFWNNHKLTPLSDGKMINEQNDKIKTYSQIGANVGAVEGKKVSGSVLEKEEKVNHPKHYNQGGIECIDAIESATIGLEGVESFYTGNIIKYIWRWKYKNGIEDLKKIQFYLNRLIGYLERK